VKADPGDDEIRNPEGVVIKNSLCTAAANSAVGPYFFFGACSTYAENGQQASLGMRKEKV